MKLGSWRSHKDVSRRYSFASSAQRQFWRSCPYRLVMSRFTVGYRRVPYVREDFAIVRLELVERLAEEYLTMRERLRSEDF